MPPDAPVINAVCFMNRNYGRRGVRVKRARIRDMRHSALLLLLALLAPRGLACSCAGQMTTQEKIDHAEVIFAGRVLSVEDPGETARAKLPEPERRAAWKNATETSHVEGWGPHWGRKVTFAVTNIWKGSPSELLELWTGYAGDCGIDFAEDVSYLVFARWSRGGRVVASMCVGTLALVCARDELRALGEPETLTLPAEREPLNPHNFSCMQWPRRISGASLTGIVPGGYVEGNLVIDREGRVAELQLEHPNARRMQEVARIVHNWCFNPASLNGKPVAVRLQIPASEDNE